MAEWSTPRRPWPWRRIQSRKSLWEALTLTLQRKSFRSTLGPLERYDIQWILFVLWRIWMFVILAASKVCFPSCVDRDHWASTRSKDGKEEGIRIYHIQRRGSRQEGYGEQIPQRRWKQGNSISHILHTGGFGYNKISFFIIFAHMSHCNVMCSCVCGVPVWN